MTIVMPESVSPEHIHTWWRNIRVALVPGPTTPVLDEVITHLRSHFRVHGHDVQAAPDDGSDVLVTTAPFGQPLNWRESVMLTARKRFGLKRTPTTHTLIHVRPAQLQEWLDRFAGSLAKDPVDPADFVFPGLADSAYRTLVEQGRRGGPIMALIRLLQAQSKCIRIVLVVGEEHPQAAYYFDLVGAYPRVEAGDPELFYADMVRRIVTSVSTSEVTKHQVVPERLTRAAWDALAAPGAMRVAGRELGQRGFFTEMVKIADLVSVPSVGDSIASQYSEGCFATWDPIANGLVATITGSARPVEKENITDDELALIVGVRADALGAVVQHVDDKRNDSPSSEAVEMIQMDAGLPRLQLSAEWGPAAGRWAPVSRSKLHGHRGIAAYDPRHVEFVPLDAPFYRYLVSCATDAQARAIQAAFARSEALRQPDDPRQVAFTVLPGHGVVMVEKWVAGKAPFQVLWEAMDAGHLVVAKAVPQGPHTYVPAADGRLELREGSAAAN
ncbi:MAG: hypothetical protein JNK29_17555 [Anaerolineales bacterium]|nr:hypothetical protein [Anaerolineales bacterium]